MLKQVIVVSVVVLFLMYLIFAYAIWDLNPSNWDITQRSISIVFSIIASALVNLIIYDTSGGGGTCGMK